MSECWLWPGRCNGNGYGEVDWFGKLRKVHRVIATMTYGQRAVHDMDIMHLCNNKACWRPSHLLPGTTSENMLLHYSHKRINSITAAARSRAAAYQGGNLV
jgi:hypothetical protein